MSTEPTVYQHGLNQAPIANVGKTGYYITKAGSRTLYRFPKEHVLPDGTAVHGHRLPHVPTRVKADKYGRGMTPAEHHARAVRDMLRENSES